MDIAFNEHVCLKLIAGAISLQSFWQKSNFILDDKVPCKHYGNEMPTNVHQNIGSFWDAAKMKHNVKRTCFHAGLRFQTSISSFYLSCRRTPTIIHNVNGPKLDWEKTLLLLFINKQRVEYNNWEKLVETDFLHVTFNFSTRK